MWGTLETARSLTSFDLDVVRAMRSADLLVGTLELAAAHRIDRAHYTTRAVCLAERLHAVPRANTKTN